MSFSSSPLTLWGMMEADALLAQGHGFSPLLSPDTLRWGFGEKKHNSLVHNYPYVPLSVPAQAENWNHRKERTWRDQTYLCLSKQTRASHLPLQQLHNIGNHHLTLPQKDCVFQEIFLSWAKPFPILPSNSKSLIAFQIESHQRVLLLCRQLGCVNSSLCPWISAVQRYCISIYVHIVFLLHTLWVQFCTASEPCKVS